LWDVESGRNTLVNFETARLQTSKPIQLATAQDSNLVFVPCMTSVKVNIPDVPCVFYLIVNVNVTLPFIET
jgi:hypothetical protein